MSDWPNGVSVYSTLGAPPAALAADERPSCDTMGTARGVGCGPEAEGAERAVRREPQGRDAGPLGVAGPALASGRAGRRRRGPAGLDGRRPGGWTSPTRGAGGGEVPPAGTHRAGACRWCGCAAGVGGSSPTTPTGSTWSPRGDRSRPTGATWWPSTPPWPGALGGSRAPRSWPATRFSAVVSGTGRVAVTAHGTPVVPTVDAPTVADVQGGRSSSPSPEPGSWWSRRARDGSSRPTRTNSGCPRVRAEPLVRRSEVRRPSG
jgi:hypothetical protein